MSSGADLPDSIRQFAFFRLNTQEPIDDPKERGRVAWNAVLEDLAALAEDESWNRAGGDPKDLPILNNYVRNTYRRLVMEEKIVFSENGKHAAFNTGLLTSYGEEIFAVFDENRNPGKQPWFFLRWAPESDNLVLRHFSADTHAPEIAEYVSSSADLVYDPTRPLKISFEHVLGDNLSRFPAELSDDPRRAREALEMAKDRALKRARRNYKVIIPQWYPKLRDEGAQFLLPLDLTGDGVADLALVVSEIGEAYRGHTVLTLDMAYSNARLVAPPNSDWLLPDAPPIPDDEEVN